MAFSNLKALLRKAAAGTADELWSVFADCLSAFTAEEFRTISMPPEMTRIYVESALAIAKSSSLPGALGSFTASAICPGQTED